MIALYPELINAVDKNNIESLTCLVRRYYGEDQVYSPTIDIELLCYKIGIPITYVDLSGSLANMYVEDNNGKFSVALTVDSRIKNAEKTFLISHMIGYYYLTFMPLLAQGDLQSEVYRCAELPSRRFQQNGYSIDTPAAIKDADTFAAAILLPRGMIKSASSRLKSIDKVAQFFRLPKLTVSRRLELISDITPASADKEREQLLAQNEGISSPVFTGEKKATDSLASKLSRPGNVNGVNKTIASNTYNNAPKVNPNKARSKPARTNGAQMAESHDKPLSGIDRIRQLAKQIDSTVSVDK